MAVQYENLSIGATVHVGGRALPSVLNAYRNAIEVCKKGGLCRRSMKWVVWDFCVAMTARKRT